MSHTQNTPYSANDLASKYHRVLGRCCYYADIDCVNSKEGSEDNMCIDFTYDKDGPKVTHIIDWKYPGESISTKYAGIQIQKHIADTLKVPFFIAITYLGDEHPVKTFYVIPANAMALAYFERCKLLPGGAYFSLKTMSKFQHALRNKKWNPEEEIHPANLAAVNLPEGTTLRQLPSDIKPYDLPKITILP